MRSEKGFTLIETLTGMFVLVLVGVSLLASLTLSSKVLIDTDKKETARDLAVAEMEYVKNLPYGDTYAPDSGLIPSGSNYNVVIDPPQDMEDDANLQMIRVIVLRNGSEVTRLEDYKVKWR